MAHESTVDETNCHNTDPKYEQFSANPVTLPPEEAEYRDHISQ